MSDNSNFWTILVSVLFGTTGVITALGSFLAKRWQSKFDDSVSQRKELHVVQEETIALLREELNEEREQHDSDSEKLRITIKEMNDAYNALYRDYVNCASRDGRTDIIKNHVTPEELKASGDNTQNNG